MRIQVPEVASMQASAARKLLASGMTVPLLAMNGLVKAYYRVLWLGAASRGGVLAALASGPRTAAALATELGLPPDAADGLSAWLDLGESVGLLRHAGGRYALRGPARPLARASNDGVVAFYEEMIGLHHPMVTQAIDRLRDGRPLAIADADPEVIARSSRMSEPYLAAAIEREVSPEGSFRLVEVGCGSGAHIRTAAALNPRLTALGLELQDEAADLARVNLTTWGLGERVAVEVGDVRDRRGEADADLITLHQNIYYFPIAERVALLRHLGGFLRPGGRLLATSICRGTGHAAAGLDLWCALTRDADRLPTADDFVAQLRDAGYTDAEATPITPDGMFVAFTGTWPGEAHSV